MRTSNVRLFGAGASASVPGMDIAQRTVVVAEAVRASVTVSGCPMCAAPRKIVGVDAVCTHRPCGYIEPLRRADQRDADARILGGFADCDDWGGDGFDPFAGDRLTAAEREADHRQEMEAAHA